MSKAPQTMEASDLYNLTHEEINNIQSAYDSHNTEVVQKAFQSHRINVEEHDYLMRFYHDGMGCCRKAYRVIYEIFGQPENTCCFDPLTGNVDTNENGQIINYGLKVVTPFVNTRLDYQDKNNNPVYIFFPKMKSPERAVEKIEKEYGHERNLKMKAALNKMFENEDREAFYDNLAQIPSTTTKLHDIMRLTVSAKYLSDVKRFARKLTAYNGTFFYIDPQETRDRFDMPLQQNPKRYYDIKAIMHLKNDNEKNLDVEIQFKIDTLMQADLRTHGYYEEVRQWQAKLDKLQAQKRASNYSEINEIEALVKVLNSRIAQINKNAVHQYNMQVLDKAYRIEDDGYRPLLTPPDFTDGTYRRCRNFINTEYIVESTDDFDSTTAFSEYNKINKLAFLRMTGKLPANFDEFSPNAEKMINMRFDTLKEAEKERFNGINEIAQRYKPIIQQRINSVKNQEKQFTLMQFFTPQRN